jgi:Uma2 family endonuclease
MKNFTLNLESIALTDKQFFQLCQNNRELKFERNANGDVVIMSPTGGETGNYNAGLTAQLWLWNQEHKLGKVFDSSTGFKLPNRANRSPDVSWITLERWNTLTAAQRKQFIPLCPDFVIELRSASDRLQILQDKMKEYIENGTRLGWLINPQSRQVGIYRQNQDIQVLDAPQTLSGEEVLPGFILHLEQIL